VTIVIVEGPTVAGIPFEVHVPAGIAYEPRRRPDWPAEGPPTVAPLVLEYEVDERLVSNATGAERYFVDEAGQLAYQGHPAGRPGEHRMRTITPGVRYAVTFPTVEDLNDWEWMWKRRLFLFALPLRRMGLALHATLFLLPDGRAIAVPGVSGAGKSTLARLLREEAESSEIRVLCDDRVALTVGADGGVRAWSTPWYSRAAAATPGSGPLAAFVVPHHGSGARLRELSKGETGRLLLRTLAVPFWDSARLASALDVMDSIANSAPAFEFSYAPVPEESSRLVPQLLASIDGVAAQ
jgi:hypothetical protein